MASKYLQKFPVPQDFPEILSDFTREILRLQPRDIIEFAVKYFQAIEKGVEFVWNDPNPRAPRPCDYPKVNRNEPSRVLTSNRSEDMAIKPQPRPKGPENSKKKSSLTKGDLAQLDSERKSRNSQTKSGRDLSPAGKSDNSVASVESEAAKHYVDQLVNRVGSRVDLREQEP